MQFSVKFFLFPLRFLIVGFQQWYKSYLLFGETDFYM